MRLTTAFFCFIWLSSVAHADIFIRNFSPEANDRFTNDAAFIGGSFDLSGIGRTTAGRWATAISRNVVVSAFHFTPGNGTLRFYESNDPGAAAVERTIQSTLRIPETDLVLGLLGEALPSSIAHYRFADQALVGTPNSTMPFTVNSAGVHQGAEVFLFGISPVNRSEDTQDLAVGRNVVTGYTENVPFNGTDNDFLLMEFEADGDPLTRFHEAELRSGDSGAPAFREDNGQLLLLGTNAIRYIPGQYQGFRQGSGINYIGNSSLAVQSFLTANAVPEPGSLILASACLSLFGRRRRRR